MKRRLILVAKIALAVGLIVFLVGRQEIDLGAGTVQLTSIRDGHAVFEIAAEPDALEYVVSGGDVRGNGVRLAVVDVDLPGGAFTGIARPDTLEHTALEGSGVGDTVSLATNAFGRWVIRKLEQHWGWLVVAQPIFGGVLLLAAWRWKVLLDAQGIHYTVREALKLSLIGFFFNQVLLGSTGGDVVKAYYVAVEQPQRRTAAVLTVFLDRIVGLIVLMGIVCAAALWNLEFVLADPLLASMVGIVGALLLAALGGGVILYSGWLENRAWIRSLAARTPFRKFLEKLSEAVLVYRHHHGRVALVGAISVALHISVTATNACLLKSLGVDLPTVGLLLLLVPSAQIVMGIPITPASWGTAEAAYDQLFRKAGIPEGFLVSLLQRFTYYVWALVGCAIYVQRRTRVREALDSAKAGAGERAPSATGGFPGG